LQLGYGQVWPLLLEVLLRRLNMLTRLLLLRRASLRFGHLTGIGDCREGQQQKGTENNAASHV
jgi:hypothetical protein